MLAVRAVEARVEPPGLTARGARWELDRLAGEIGWYEEEARKTVMLALQYKLEIGRRLRPPLGPRRRRRKHGAADHGRQQDLVT